MFDTEAGLAVPFGGVCQCCKTV